MKVKQIISLFLVIVMLFAIAACGKKDKKETEKSTTEPTKSDIKNNGIETNGLSTDENILNILLVGEDYGEKSDAIMLMSIDNNHKKMKFMSFQRDTYVAIPNHGDDKLNNAFYLGGIDLLSNTVEVNFGIAIDKYIITDINNFIKIVDILGGVEIELSTEEIKYINAQIDVNDQTSKTSFIPIDRNAQKQVVNLDGYQAMWYVRNRGAESLGGVPAYSFSGDDWDRTNRQRKLLIAIMASLKKATVDEILEITNNVGPNITTNLKKEDILFLVSNSLTYLEYEPTETTVPTQGTWKYSIADNGLNIIEVTDWEQMRKDVASFIYEEQVIQ